MAKIIAITNQKGGVGKTTTSVNLSACVAAEGKRVLVVDADPQGNTSSGLGVRVKEKTPTVYEVMAGETPIEQALCKTAVKGLMVLPADIRLAGAEIELANMEHRERVVADMLEGVRDRFDYIFIDCPPSLGMITLNALCAADGVLIPIQCEYFALEGVSALMGTVQKVQKMNRHLAIEGVVLTMLDARTNLGVQVAHGHHAHFILLHGRFVFHIVFSRVRHDVPHSLILFHSLQFHNAQDYILTVYNHSVNPFPCKKRRFSLKGKAALFWYILNRTSNTAASRTDPDRRAANHSSSCGSSG